VNAWADTLAPARRWEGLALIVVAIACLAFQLRMPTLTPSEADFKAAAAIVEAEAQGDDVILLTPWWTERARGYLPTKLVTVGYQGSDAEDFKPYRRIWVLAQPSMPRFSWSGFLEVFGAGRVEVGQERTFGPLSLRLFTNGRARPVLFSANASLARARVFLEGPQGQQPCAFSGRGWRCPNGGEVVEEWHELHFEPHRCLRFYPPGGPTKLVAEFDGVPAVDELQLITGYIWERGAYPSEGPTDFGLEVNGQAQVTTLPPTVEKVYRVSREKVAAGTVRAWVQANNASNRELCFELYGFGPGGA